MRGFLSLFAVAVLAVSCAPALVILHTNDTHSHLDPGRGGSDRGMGGAIERAAFVDSVRSAHCPSNVMLVHAGDWNQGSSYFTELGGELEVRIVNDFGYDVIALGNHEFDNGIEDLEERLKKVKVPVVCANIDFTGHELADLVRPWVVIRKAGRRIGVIGLEAELEACVSKTISSRLRRLDPVECVNKWAAYLRNEERCDIVIVLSHQGYEEDQNIASRSRGTDLFIGGHTHTFVDDFISVRDLDGRQVRIITDGKWGIEMGEITIR